MHLWTLPYLNWLTGVVNGILRYFAERTFQDSKTEAGWDEADAFW